MFPLILYTFPSSVIIILSVLYLEAHCSIRVVVFTGLRLYTQIHQLKEVIFILLHSQQLRGVRYAHFIQPITALAHAPSQPVTSNESAYYAGEYGLCCQWFCIQQLMTDNSWPPGKTITRKPCIILYSGSPSCFSTCLSSWSPGLFCMLL